MGGVKAAFGTYQCGYVVVLEPSNRSSALLFHSIVITMSS